MAWFKYIGDPRHDGEGRPRIALFGHRFERGAAVEVTDAVTIAKLAGNPHFAVVDGAATAKARPRRAQEAKRVHGASAALLPHGGSGVMTIVASKSRDELIARALVKLLVIGAGQSPDAEDAACVNDAVDGVLADLAARGVADVVDADDIPIAWFENLAEILAQSVAADFGAQRDDGRIALAEMALRRKNAASATSEAQRVEYF